MAANVRADNANFDQHVNFDIDPDSNSYLDANGILHGYIEPDAHSDCDCHNSNCYQCVYRDGIPHHCPDCHRQLFGDDSWWVDNYCSGDGGGS